MRTVISRITDKGYVREAQSEAADGERLRGIFESRQCPASVTDRELFRNRGTLADQFAGDEQNLNRLVQIAKENGYTPNPNDFYNSALAGFPGDPLGFIPATGGRNHIKKVCELRDQDCEGIVNHKRDRYRDPAHAIDKGPALAPDIVDEMAYDLAVKNPDKRRKTKGELREEIIAKHGSK